MSSGNARLWQQETSVDAPMPKQQLATAINIRLAVAVPASINLTARAGREFTTNPDAIDDVDHNVMAFGDMTTKKEVNKGPLTTTTQPFLIPVCEPEHISYFELALQMQHPKRHNAHPYQKNDWAKRRANLLMTMSHLTESPTYTCVELKDFSDPEADIAAVAHHFNISTEALKSHYTGQKILWYGSITFKGPIVDTSLFSCEFEENLEPVEVVFLKYALEAATEDNPVVLSWMAFSDRIGAALQRSVDSIIATAVPESGSTYRNTVLWYREKRVNPVKSYEIDDRADNPHPPFRIRSRFVYFDKEEYFTTLFWMLMCEMNHLGASTNLEATHAARYLEVPQLGDKVYYMLIDQKESAALHEDGSHASRFNVDDHIEVDFHGDKVKSTKWFGIVVEPLSCAYPDDICVRLLRRWVVPEKGKFEDGAWDDFKIPSEACIPVANQTDDEAVLNQLATLPYHQVSIQVISSIEAIRRQVSGLAYLWMKRSVPYLINKIDWLLGSRRSRQPAVHAFQYLLDKGVTQQEIDNMITTMATKHTLNPSQIAAISRLGTPIPGGSLVVNGPGGVGKSSVFRAVIDMLFQFKLKGPEFRAKVVYVAPYNTLVDEISIKLNALDSSLFSALSTEINTDGKIEKLDRKLAKLGVIIRAHGARTERKTGYSDATAQRDAGEEHPWTIIEDPENILPEEVLSQMQVGQHLLEQYRKSSIRTVHGVADKRLVHPELSLAVLVLQIAALDPKFFHRKGGIVTSTHPLAPEHGTDAYVLFDTFALKYNRWAEKDEFTEQESKDFALSFNACCDWVLENCIDVLVTTASNACTQKYGRMAGQMIVGEGQSGKQTIDETARGVHFLLIEELSCVPQATMAVLIAYYRPAFIMMNGDQAQLPPHYNLDEKTHYDLAGLYMRSEMVRQLLTGAPQALISEQMRMCKDLCDLLNFASPYTDLFPAQSILQRTSTETIRAAFRNLGFSGDLTVGIVDNDSQCITAEYGNHSSRNPGDAEVTLHLVWRLALQGIPFADILIVVPYHDALGMYRSVIKRLPAFLRTQGEEWAGKADTALDLKCVTIDSVQGQEAPVVLYNIVVSNKLGHLKLQTRNVTAFSRAKDGLLVIGNFSGLDRAYQERSTPWMQSPLHKSHEYCKKRRMVIKTAPEEGKVIKMLSDFINSRETLRSIRLIAASASATATPNDANAVTLDNAPNTDNPGADDTWAEEGDWRGADKWEDSANANDAEAQDDAADVPLPSSPILSATEDVPLPPSPASTAGSYHSAHSSSDGLPESDYQDSDSDINEFYN